MAEHFHFHEGRKADASHHSPVIEFRNPHQPPRAVRWFWPIFYGVVLAIALLFLLLRMAHAGGPAYVAGASYFDPSVNGVPLTWAGGSVSFYTDPGDLSPLLPHAGADAFVADAFSRWTLIPTAAVAATEAGALAEDVNGSNVTVNSDGSINMPSDILPAAVTKPVAIVYDADGKVTDALLGSGAGGPLYCFSNAVFGGTDNLGTDAHFLHALIILNGNCAQTSAQLPDVKYRLVRVFGRVLGLDWSQVNVNVQTRNPVPVPEDFAGFPVMHATDHSNCVPISLCYPNADVPKMDDQAALSRLYPVTSQNLGNFPGKQLFFENSIRIHGSVYFVANGLAGQPMQGVNVVARWIDPASGQPSRTYAAAAVSGFLFHGYAGNPVNGNLDGTGQPFDRFGANDPIWEGFYDLAGLQIPNGGNSAQYQLTVEALDPVYSQLAEPYGPWQVQPSGAAQPITVTVSKGGDAQQDVLMQGSASPTEDSFDPAPFDAPAPVPSSGEWAGSLSPYGESDYFRFAGQMNRTLTVEVTALDELGALSENKALPVIGMWALADPPGTLPPAATPMAFNSVTWGMSQLSVNLLQTTDFRVGVSDFRGDGRPDYRYHARLFYGNAILPARARVGGGTPLTVQGYGFRPGNTVSIAAMTAPAMSTTPNQMVAIAPAMKDGVEDVVLNDPTTGAKSTMTGVVTYGAGPTDTIRLLSTSNPPTPVGGQAVNPVRVKVLAADGVTPVAGASVQFSATPTASFDLCGSASTCTLLSDDSGELSVNVTVLSVGATTITATLAPASYPMPKLVQTTILGTSSGLDVAAVAPYKYIAQGATVDIPLSVRVLTNGFAVSGKTVKYTIVAGAGTLTSTTPTSDSNGYASTTLHLSSISGAVQVTACAEPGDAPCQTFYGAMVASSQLQLKPVSGSLQTVTVGQSFARVIVRVTDSAIPGDSVVGAGVFFQTTVLRPQYASPIQQLGDTIVTSPSTPVILSSWQGVIVSDNNGLASLQTATGMPFAAETEGTGSIGGSVLSFELQAVAPPGSNNSYTMRGKNVRRSLRLNPRSDE
jgi:hypothetical protein